MPVIKLISWNIKDFGDYDRSPNLDFIVTTLQHGDIVLIQEIVCNRFSKRLKVGIDVARSSGIEAVTELTTALATNDPTAGWTSQVSRVNATTPKRDAYAYLWKATPSAAKFPSSPDAPNAITVSGTADIVSSDTTKQFPDRRPCMLEFVIDGETIPIFNFHASVDKPIDSCRILSEVDEIADAPKGIIAGDFNADFRNQFAFDNVYKFLKDQIGYEPCLGNLTGPTTGIRTSIGPSQIDTGYVSKAYDNVLVKNLKRKRGSDIDIIEKVRVLDYSHVNEGRGRKLAVTKIYPKSGKKVRFGKRLKKVACVSDHIPVETDIEV